MKRRFLHQHKSRNYKKRNHCFIIVLEWPFAQTCVRIKSYMKSQTEPWFLKANTKWVHVTVSPIMRKIFIFNIYYNNHQPYWEVLEALNLHTNWPLGNYVLMPPMWVCRVLQQKFILWFFFLVWFFPLVSHAKAQTISISPRNPRAFRRPLYPEEFYSSNGLLDKWHFKPLRPVQE